MSYQITPYSKKIVPFAWWDGAFNEEELDWIQEKTKKAKHDAGLGACSIVDTKIRSANLDWLHPSDENIWIFERLSHIASSVNAEHFNFDLTGFCEGLQLTHYDESKSGHYTWHQDFGAGDRPSRKLSMVLQLSHPEEYEGGELRLLTNENPTIIEKKRGLIAIFPSWTLHQVTPVTKGNRQTLVTWVTGPAFK